MARVTVEDCLDQVGNRFALIILAANRSRQLLKGAKPTVAQTKNKAAVLSLREIAAGHVYPDADLIDVLSEDIEKRREMVDALYNTNHSIPKDE